MRLRILQTYILTHTPVAYRDMSPRRKINEVKTKQNINVQWSQMCEHVEAKIRRKTIKRGYLVFTLGWFLLFALDNYPIPCPHHITWFSVYRVTHDAPHDPCIILFFLCNILIWSWVTLSFSLSLHHTQCNAWRVEIGGWDSCSITLQYLFSLFSSSPFLSSFDPFTWSFFLLLLLWLDIRS